MILYCQYCNNLIDKISEETYSQGDLIVRKCQKCENLSRYFIQYKAIMDKKWVRLTERQKFDIIRA
jgi:RNase P subunit RPR2